jgi:hypothetical protein
MSPEPTILSTKLNFDFNPEPTNNNILLNMNDSLFKTIEQAERQEVSINGKTEQSAAEEVVK